MQIAKPQVHLRRNTTNGDYYIHVVTWFDRTVFIADGIDSIGTSAVNGAFPVTLIVAESGTTADMQLLTPVVHTILIENPFTILCPMIDVIIINSSDSNSEVGRRRVHKDDADDSSMPSPIGK